MICIKFTCSLRDLYTLAEGIMISVRSFQCSEGDVFDPIKYIYFWISFEFGIKFIKIGRLYHIAAIETIEKLVGK